MAWRRVDHHHVHHHVDQQPLPAAAPSWHSMTQAQAEQGLTFCGLAIMVNPLRPDTAAVLTNLQVVCEGLCEGMGRRIANTQKMHPHT